MAEKGNAAGKKGVAIAKRAKIDAAQRNMLIAVSIASIALGVTIVAVIYFVKTIQFNGAIIDKNNEVIKDLKTAQDNLEKLKQNIADLSENERLEVVARTRSSNCNKSTDENTENTENVENAENSDENSNQEKTDDQSEVEIARVCSALRVVSDAMPSQYNEDASMSSINWLILNNNEDVNLEAISGDRSMAGGSAGADLENVHLIGATIMIKDSATKVRKSISSIENSIRNYDIKSATINWTETASGEMASIELSATYASYYSDDVSVTSKRLRDVICADKTSDGCKKAKGSSN